MTLTDVTGVIPHCNVVMVTLDPYGYMEGSILVFSVKPGDMCTMSLEVHIPGVYHAPDEIFLLIPSLLYKLRMATVR